MSHRMVHYVGGPTDGRIELMRKEHHPFRASISTDTDGYYGMEYQVAGQRIGDLELTDEDVVAQWHQRSSPDDFMTGDTVIVKATGAYAMVLADAAQVHDDGTVIDGLMIIIDTNQAFVRADEIRIATAAELN